MKQKGESQNGCFQKIKHAKFSEKRTSYPLYAQVRELNTYKIIRPFALLPTAY